MPPRVGPPGYRPVPRYVTKGKGAVNPCYVTLALLCASQRKEAALVLSNAERQARYRQRLKDSAYEADLLRKQIAALERAVNEARAALGLPEIQLPKSAHKPHR